MRIAAISVLAAFSVFARPVQAAEERDPRATSLTITGGKVVAAFAAEADLRTRFGLVLGATAGWAKGPAVGGHVAYRLPSGSRWSLEPGVRVQAIWAPAEGCGERCQFDFVTLELGLHYQDPSGFVFEAGLPIVAWIPVGPEEGQSRPHLQPYVLSEEAMVYAASLLLGCAFDL